MTREEAAYLLVRNASRVYAMDLRHVVETTPVLTIEALADVPLFVLGIAVVRGLPTPVVDLGALLEGTPSRAERFVILSASGRRVALAVQAVMGVRRAELGVLHALPSLAGTANAERLEGLGLVDAELLVVLRAARLVPEDVIDALHARGAAL